MKYIVEVNIPKYIEIEANNEDEARERVKSSLVRGVAIIASALKSKGKIVMEKVLLNAKQAAELSLEKGYEWFKNQVFKQIRETAERGESELHWGISYPFVKDYLEDTSDKIFSTPSIGNIYITNVRKIKSLLTDYGYTVKFVTCEDDDSYELVTELVITWYN